MLFQVLADPAALSEDGKACPQFAAGRNRRKRGVSPGPSSYPLLEEDTMIRRTIKIVFASALATVFAAGLFALSAPARAVSGNCICPDIYAPVKCSNGVTYPNACRASCAHAKNCVPTGDV
jgi:hypothetical protein